MKQMVIRLKHSFIVMIRSFGRTKSFINTWNTSYRQIQVLLFVNWRHVYQGLHISPQPSLEHRMLDTNAESCVVHSTTAEWIPHLLNSKKYFKIWQGIGIICRILKTLESPKINWGVKELDSESVKVDCFYVIHFLA